MSKISKIRRIIREEIENFMYIRESSPILRRGFFSLGIGGDFDQDISTAVNEQESNDIQTLNFFDFDGTLMDTPEPEEGKKLYADLTGEDYPYKGWWGKKESLEPFDIKPIVSTVKEYNNRKDEPNSLTILMTNRIKELEPIVKNILDKNNLYFDDYDLKSGKQEKTDRIKEYIKKYPSVKNINVFDDRDKEIAMFKDLKKELAPQGIYVNIFHIKK